MSIRKRRWKTPKGEIQEAWVVDFRDANLRRRLKTFAAKKDAEKFETHARAAASGITSVPSLGYRPDVFDVVLSAGWKKGSGREAVAAAYREKFPGQKPSTDGIIVHVLASIRPAPAICDVDNLLKPVLDALTGVVWVDDTQVYELLVQRQSGRGRDLRISIWRIPQRSIVDYQLARYT